MSTLDGDNDIWEDFILDHNIESDEEEEFLEYLFEEDLDPDTLSSTQLFALYEGWVDSKENK